MWSLLKRILRKVGCWVNGRGNLGDTTLPPTKGAAPIKETEKFKYFQGGGNAMGSFGNRSTAEEIAANLAYWEEYRKQHPPHEPSWHLMYKPREKPEAEQSPPLKVPKLEMSEAWRKANKKYHKSKEWKELRKKILKRANHRCEICHERPATSVHRRVFPPPEECQVFQKPEESKLQALCGECARERYKPSDLSDPRHPWFPDGG